MGFKLHPVQAACRLVSILATLPQIHNPDYSHLLLYGQKMLMVSV